MMSAVCDNEIVAVLQVNYAGRTCSCELRNGERLYVGTDSESDLVVPDPDVAPTHCAVMGIGDKVAVEDCYSQNGTLVDGQKIRAIQLSRSSQVRIGTTTIDIKLRCPATDGTFPAPEPAVPQPTSVEQPGIAEFADNTADTAAESAEQESVEVAPQSTEDAPQVLMDTHPNSLIYAVSSEAEKLKLELLQAHEENRVLQKRLTAAATAATTEPADAPDPYQDEMIELLRAEILDLQAELAEFHGGGQTHPSTLRNDDVLPRDEAEKLVSRLEELLAELQQRDDQIDTLTELLQLAEDANRTTREEREQLDNWLNDIEVRFGQREQDWQAERAELQRAMDELTQERDRAEAALNADSMSGKLEAAQNVLQSLRETADAQRKRLLESEQTIIQLKRELEHANAGQHGPSHEELSKLAEERAELARLRQETKQTSTNPQRDNLLQTDLKLRALRQHLSEIHAEERAAAEAEREQKKLSSRLSRLWRRLEGR